jgi:hypothetical protein
MLLLKKSKTTVYFTALSSVSVLVLLVLQSLWLYTAYQLTFNRFIVEVNEAFDEAYRKEQLYRMPVGGLINPGDFTIQSCSAEEIRIIRHCPAPDTVTYDNMYGHSIETFINRAFYELREQMMPLNIYCLADLFAGALHDKDIPISFVIERFNPITGEIVEISAPQPDNTESVFTHAIIINVSETEGLRANLQFMKRNIFSRMPGTLACSASLLLLALGCFAAQLMALRRGKYKAALSLQAPDVEADSTFHLGKYCFDVDKNELQGCGVQIQLNKKENGILEDLCMEHGKVVERSRLLEKHWGGNGFIYSRSLDTYIATLRKYLKNDASVQIVTIKGVGYKITF